MEQILRFEKQVPLTYSLLKRAVPKWVQCRMYDELSRFKTLQQASSGKPCLIVLYTLKETSKRGRGGHYSLVILDGPTRYWSSHGYPVEHEIALDEVAYQARNHTETCWRWCLLRSSLYKLPETRFLCTLDAWTGLHGPGPRVYTVVGPVSSLFFGAVRNVFPVRPPLLRQGRGSEGGLHLLGRSQTFAAADPPNCFMKSPVSSTVSPSILFNPC